MPLTTWDQAQDAVAAIDTYGGQVAVGERQGDLAALLAARAVALSLLAVAEAIRNAAGSSYA